MQIVTVPVGADVSKGKIDISIDGRKSLTVENNPKGWEALLGKLPQGSCLYMECTGGFDRPFRRHMLSAGVQVQMLNAYHARRYADAMGLKGKTDALDAKLLAQAGPHLRGQRAKSAEQEGLTDLSRHISRLKSELADDRKRLQQPALHESVRRSLERRIRYGESEILALEKEFASLVAKSDLRGRYQLLRSVPGVGPCLARVLACELPADVSDLDSGNVGSYAGIAPMDRQSGLSRRASTIRKGNRHIKAALYMPALSCLCNQAWARDLHERLRAKGKTHEQAMVAVMRRLLIRAFAVAKRGSEWQNVSPPA